MSKPKYTVCPECEGEGSTSNFTFTASDIDEWYGDDMEARDDFVSDYRARKYDQACPECKGQRVVAACHCGESLLFVDSAYRGRVAMSGCYEHITDSEHDYLTDLSVAAAERAFGC